MTNDGRRVISAVFDELEAESFFHAAVHDRFRLGGGLFFRVAVADQVEAHVQADARHMPDKAVLRPHFLKPVQGVRAELGGMFRQPLVLKDGDFRQGRRSAERVFPRGCSGPRNGAPRG